MTTAEILQPLTAPLASLPGLGGKSGEALAKSVGERVIDLLFAAPSRQVANRLADSIAAARPGEYQGISIEVEGVYPPRQHARRSPWLVSGRDGGGRDGGGRDDSGKLTMVFFKNPGNYLKKLFPLGEQVVVFGKLEQFRGRLQIVHPNQVVKRSQLAELPKFRATYSYAGGIFPLTRKKALDHALELAKGMTLEWQPKPTMPWLEAVTRLHYPEKEADFQLPSAVPSAVSSAVPSAVSSAVRRRLAYDELLAEQLVLALNNRRRKPGIAVVGNGKLVAAAMERLDFTLTADQRQAVDEIAADLATPKLMNRLLQGDVGSGKTIVAVLLMLRAVEGGFQAAMMAPTDFLVSQHLKTVTDLVKGLGVTVIGLSGGGGKANKQARRHIADGNAAIIIGTHALFQEKVEFANLALVVIDEQQRFGVAQRLALGEKGGDKAATPNILSLSATPIPRTLALTKHFGMGLSTLRNKPHNRARTITNVLPLERLDEVVDRLAAALGRGEQAFWICPSIQAEEESALENRFEALAKVMPKGFVAKAHGAMPDEERQAAMAAFRRLECRLLVATTVVEVGIDVPTADIMVVENAERFGLAQLHQLRGRIGRGGGVGKMLGVYDSQRLSPIAWERLQFFKGCDDGFQLAEKDLELRQSGEVLGTRQSGLAKRRFADEFSLDADLLEAANAQAVSCLTKKSAASATALRTLLGLFGYELWVKYLEKAG